MPASTISPDLNCNTNHAGGLEDQRALQLALELTMLGLNTPENEIDSNEYNDMNDDITKKRSQNMTECVPVPSSEHVAEIVGRQGCKIKALRAKTNTYIKTPVRGEEPVFVVTGRKEDVGDAKREILSAADHFSQIRASRRNNNHGTVNGMCPPSPNSPGQVTLQVRVPYRVVGLVVGPKGATIKRIQQLTHTYIVTPSRDKEPVFEVTGSAEHVEKARLEIEKHIAMRTGGMLMENSVTPDDIENNGFDVDQLGNDQRNNGMNYNSVFNAMNNMNGNLLRQNLIMPEYNLNAGKREAFELNGGYPSDLMYDPYSLLGQYRREEELTSQWSGMSSGSVWADTGRMQIPYGGKMVTPGRRGSLDTSPHLSPGSDGSHGSQTTLPSHATIRRISSDPVTSTDASNAWNAFPPIEFTSAFPTQSADSPPIQDN